MAACIGSSLESFLFGWSMGAGRDFVTYATTILCSQIGFFGYLEMAYSVPKG